MESDRIPFSSFDDHSDTQSWCGFGHNDRCEPSLSKNVSTKENCNDVTCHNRYAYRVEEWSVLEIGEGRTSGICTYQTFLVSSRKLQYIPLYRHTEGIPREAPMTQR